MPEKGEHEYKLESLLKRLRALFCKGRLHAVRLILINVVNIYVQISIDFAWNKIGGGNVRNPRLDRRETNHRCINSPLRDFSPISCNKKPFVYLCSRDNAKCHVHVVRIRADGKAPCYSDLKVSPFPFILERPFLLPRKKTTTSSS